MCACQVIDSNGAPEEIRTPDPQIRSLAARLDVQAENCKPRPKPPKRAQGVRARSANRKKPSGVDPHRPQKRSPTLAANKRRANRLNKCSKRKSTAARPNAQGPARHFYWIADGQTNIGFVEQVGKSYRAIGADEKELGTFNSLKSAADAVSERIDRRGGADA
jgi:hypothetical protein